MDHNVHHNVSSWATARGRSMNTFYRWCTLKYHNLYYFFSICGFELTVSPNWANCIGLNHFYGMIQLSSRAYCKRPEQSLSLGAFISRVYFSNRVYVYTPADLSNYRRVKDQGSTHGAT